MICPECGANGYRRENPRAGERHLWVWCCEKCLFEWEETDPDRIYDHLIREGMYYKDAYSKAHGTKAPNSMPPRTPGSDVEWPDTGWLTSSFSFRNVPFTITKRLSMVAMFACLAIAFLGIAGYAETGFPHGPKFFTGEFQEVCQDDRRCREVPVYEEDTSNLENPGWVGFIWSSGLLVILPGIIFGIVAIIQGSKIQTDMKSIRVSQVYMRNHVFEMIELNREYAEQGYLEKPLENEIRRLIADGEQYVNREIERLGRLWFR